MNVRKVLGAFTEFLTVLLVHFLKPSQLHLEQLIKVHVV